MGDKINMTIRLDDLIRNKLEFIADRELRPLANQALFFIVKGINSYFKDPQVQDEYLKRNQTSDESPLEDIPF